MDYATEIFPLSHFVLWSKGWYHKVHNTGDMNQDLEDTMKSVFSLDGYIGEILQSKEFANLLLYEFEQYNNWAKVKGGPCLSLVTLFEEVKNYQSSGYNYYNSIIMALRSYFQCIPSSRIKLSKPVYSRELYREYDLVKGSLFSKYVPGITYQDMNNIVNQYQW